MGAPTTPRDPFVEIVLTAEEVAEIERKFNKDEYDTLDIEALLVSHERMRAQLLAVLLDGAA